MKIEDIRNNHKTVKFKDIGPGEPFDHNGIIFLRTACPVKDDSGHYLRAVRLDDGNLYTFYNDDICTPVNAKVVVSKYTSLEDNK